MIDKKLCFVMQFIILSSICGCSWLNIGENDYSCPGIENGVTCASVEDVYLGTSNGQDYERKTDLKNTKDDQIGNNSKVNSNFNSSDKHISASSLEEERLKQVSEDYITPNLPNGPIPIRTQAKIMRIWINSWEDRNGDLYVPSYIYTEIEPRRWVIGDKENTERQIFTPLY